jgi:flavorubredoxin
MYNPVHISEKIFYVGVNDRQKHMFENMIPLPSGVSYNSYLIVDEKIALIDTVDVCYVEVYLKKIERILKGREIDYLIVNHMEPDHSSSINLVKQKYPNIQIIGNVKTFRMIEGFYGINNHFYEVKDGDTLSLGHHQLQFYMTPMVHWPETMVTYDAVESVLFSGDAFGAFGTLDGAVIDTQLNTDKYWDDMRRYYANIVGKYGAPVQKALAKLSTLKIKTICSTHGPVWRENVDKVIGIYDKLSRYEGEDGVVVVYGSMYGNTEQMAEVVAQGLAEGGVKNIIIHNVSKSHPSIILSDIFRYKGLIIGSPTYSNELYPEIASLLAKIETRDIKNRYFGYFGSFTWAGAAFKNLANFAERMKWEVVGEPVEQQYTLNLGREEHFLALGKAMSEKFL